jgi:hypothetical protein
MTVQHEPIAPDSWSPITDGRVIAAACSQTGNWLPAAAWLAGRLNAIDEQFGQGPLDDDGRSVRTCAIDHQVGIVDGDRRETDVVILTDGSRVCWHLGATRRRTRWVVEGGAERCSWGAGG